jgi:hypothetical protein
MRQAAYDLRAKKLGSRMRSTSILVATALGAAAAFGLAACRSSDRAPPPQPQPAAQPQPQPQLSADECLSLVSQGLTTIRRSPQGAVTDWQVQLQNRCPQGGPVSIEFWVLDRNNTAIGYQRQVVSAPPSAAFAASGQISVPPAQSQLIASTITRYGVETQ